MTRILFIFLFLFSLYALSEDLTTKSGAIYKKYTVHGVSKRGVSITHSYGGCIIPFYELPDKLKEKYLSELKQKKDALSKQQSSGGEDRSEQTTQPASKDIKNDNPKSETNYKSETFSNSSGRVIHTGPRGGRYYINKNGNKTYVRRKK